MISFCLITRNCARTLPATLESIRPVADEICLVDGGSTDGTRDIALRYGARIIIAGPDERPDWYMEIPDGKGGTEITLAEFAQARNLSFGMAKGDAIFWIDGDDHLANIDAWPEMVRAFRDGNVDAMILPYDYMFDAKGRCTTVLWRERLLKNRPDLRWIDPVHETIPTIDLPYLLHYKVRVVHHKHERTDVNVRRNLEILKARADKASPRTLFYLGVEHLQAQEFKEAAVAFEDYLKVSWDQDETYQALFYLGDLHRVFGSWEASITNYQKATVLQPRWRTAYVGMAMTFAAQEDWARAVHYAEVARDLEEMPITALCVNPEHERVGWVEPLAKGLRGLGRVREALAVVDKGLSLQDDNADLIALRQDLARRVNGDLSTGAHHATIESLVRNDDSYKAAQVAQLLNDESAIGLLAKRAVVDAHMGGLPGRTLEVVDLDAGLEDQRLRWFLEWVGRRPGIRTVAAPGCGGGLLSTVCHELLGKAVTAWDPDPWPSMHLGGLSYIAPSGHHLIVQHKPLQQPALTKYDLVLLENVLEHTLHPDTVLKMAVGFVKPGGTLLALVPESPFDPEGAPPSLTNLRLRPFGVRNLKWMTGTWQAPVKMKDLKGRSYLAAWLDIPLDRRIAPRRISILCGDAVEPWDWTVLERGCGASEEAVIRVARILTERGHTVTIYGAGVGEDVGPWGVVPYERRTDYVEQDLCIVWRSPELLLQQKAPAAEWHWLWLQDNLDPGLVEAAAARCDRVLVMSAWHGTLYPSLGRKAEIVGNGIERAEVSGDAGERKPNRFIWASCPTRGLDALLEAWPRIRASLPGADLHVYYGLEMIQAVMRYRPPEVQKVLVEKIAKIERLSKQVGVEWHGRVSVAAVSEAMKSAGVWAYPVDFDEGFCHPPGTMIVTRRGMIPIESVTAFDEVLTHKARFRRVLVVRRRAYKGEMVRLRAANSEHVDLTPDHPVYASERLYWNKSHEKQTEFSWVLARDVRQSGNRKSGHAAYIPRQHGVGVDRWVLADPLQLRRRGRQYQENDVNMSVLLDKAMCRWIGLLVGDGHCGYRNLVGIYLDHRQSDLAKEAADGFEKFGLKATTCVARNVLRVQAYSGSLSRALRAEVYCSDGKKKLPDIFWDLSDEQKGWVLDGLILADGNISRRPGARPHTHYTTNSAVLAGQVRSILNSLGIAAKIQRRVHKDGRESFLLRYADSYSGPVDQRRFRTFDDHLSVKVYGRETYEYDGDVFNMQVEEDESYISGQIALHNCATAARAQACGCWPVIYNRAALAETVAWGRVTTPDTLVEGCVAMANNPDDRSSMRAWARSAFAWERVADKFERMMEVP